MRWRMVGIAWLCLGLMACSSAQQNNEKPVFGKETYWYKGCDDYCQRHLKDIDCR